MHLILDGSVLPALFVLAITIWACAPHVVDLFTGSKVVVRIVATFALVVSVVIAVLALVRL